MQINFHSLLWSYLPRVPIILTTTVHIYIYIYRERERHKHNTHTHINTQVNIHKVDYNNIHHYCDTERHRRIIIIFFLLFFHSVVKRKVSLYKLTLDLSKIKYRKLAAFVTNSCSRAKPAKPCSEPLKAGFPYRAVTRHHGDFSVMGTPSLQPFLKSYWLTPVK